MTTIEQPRQPDLETNRQELNNLLDSFPRDMIGYNFNSGEITEDKLEQVKQLTLDIIEQIYGRNPTREMLTELIEKSAMASFDGTAEGTNAEYGSDPESFVKNLVFWLDLAERIRS